MASQISTFSPYNDESVGSFHFDGYNYIALKDDLTAFQPGTGAFTFEFWVFLNNIDSNDYHTFFDNRDTGTDSDAFFFGMHGSASGPGSPSGMAYFYTGTTDYRFGSSQVLENNVWHHLALVRTSTGSGGLQLYLDGVGGTAMTVSNDFTNTNNSEALFGQHVGSTAYNLYGYMSDIRFVKGTAVYTGNFTPPSGKLTTTGGTYQSTTNVNTSITASHTTFLAQPGNNANLNRDTAAPEDRKVFAAISAGIGQEPQTVINEGTSITSTGADGTTYTYQSAMCVPALPEGKWYFELRDQNFSALNVALIPAEDRLNEGPGSGNNMGGFDDRLSFVASTGYLQLHPAGGTVDTTYWETGVGSSPNPNTGAIFGIDYDTVTNTFGISKNGGTRYTRVVDTSDFVMLGKRIGMSDGSSYAEGNLQINFGQNPTFNGNITPSGGTNSDGSYPDADGIGGFRYAPPTGYKALRFVGPSRSDGLNNAALAPNKYFDTLLYVGNSTAGHRIRGLNFKPDLIWIKDRDYSSQHVLVDSVRGHNRELHPNLTNGEQSPTTASHVSAISAINDDGFTLNVNVNPTGSTNGNGSDLVAWCWKAGEDSFINTDGTIDSECSVNQDAGFSIVSYFGTNTTSTVGHGLSKTPDMVITKSRTATSLTGWMTSHVGLQGSTYNVILNDTDVAWQPSTNGWVSNGNSKTFSLNNGTSDGNNVNQSGVTYIAYCWHSVEGYSKFGSYEGNNNADGTFVYLGFKPAWVLIKNIDNGTFWTLFDYKRSPFNLCQNTLNPNNSNVEETSGGNGTIDMLSNGFKCRNTDSGTNASYTYIYMAFAETPSAFTNSR